ncbi:MAG: HemK/PrmC family methyltransferase [Spirochaetota bacterium]
MNTLFDKYLQIVLNECTFSPDLPRETPESTIYALWHCAAGTPFSAEQAILTPLPDLNDEEKVKLDMLVRQRTDGTPLAHITRRMHFMDMELVYRPEVLVARSETEILGESLVEILGKQNQQSSTQVIIEIGCGSGNLTCSVLYHLPYTFIYAVDITEPCAALTRENLKMHSLHDRARVFTGDMFSPLSGLSLEGAVDAVFSNPPYISTKALSDKNSHLLTHEPREAFDGGPFGLSIHQRLIKESGLYLKHGGYLFFEFGLGQERQVELLFSRNSVFSKPEFKKDPAGNPRVAYAKKQH